MTPRTQPARLTKGRCGAALYREAARSGTLGGHIGLVKRTWPLLAAAIVLSLGGAYLSRTLLNRHLRTPGAPAWLNAMCESAEGGRISCDKVLASRWAWIPPINEGDPKGQVRYPVAGLGVAYYIMLLTWFAGVGRPSYASRRWHLLPLTVNACGVLGSVGFVWLMAFEVDAWCPLCLATHVINGALLAVNILLRPHAPARAQHPKSKAERTARASTEAAVPRYPSRRLALVVIGLGVMITGALNQGNQIARLSSVNKRMRKVIQDVQRSGEALAAGYQSEPEKEITIRPDDPMRHNGEGLPVMVVWSDFECEHCRKFAEDFEETYYGQFDGFVRMVFKHFPLCMDCNKYLKTRAHPYSCKAARLAEAVRMQGGDEKFWKVHDLLFRRQDRLKDLDPRTVATGLGLDPDKLIADMSSDAVQRRIAEDIDQGRSLGVSATPAVFLGGRRISSLARSVPSFWKVMGALARQERAQRQGDTRQGDKPAAATPDSRGQPGAR